MWNISSFKKNQAQKIHKHFGIIVLADVYNQADKIKETIKCVLAQKKSKNPETKWLILKVRKGSHALFGFTWQSNNRGWWEEAHLGTLRSETRLVEYGGDLVYGMTERRRTALSQTGWELIALI